MNNDLTFWRKLMLELLDNPKTDADIAYIYRNMVRPEIPASALWDAEKGAEIGIRPKYENMFDARKRALKNRGWYIGQTNADMPEKTPTGAIMQQLLNPDYLVVPEKKDMSNIWE